MARYPEATAPSGYNNQVSGSLEPQQGLAGVKFVAGYAFSTALLQYVPLLVDNTGALIVTGGGGPAPGLTGVIFLQAFGITTSQVLIAGVGGKQVQLLYYRIQGSPQIAAGNYQDAQLIWSGASGQICRDEYPPGAVIARNIGAGDFEGISAIGEGLNLVLARSTGPVNVNLEYLLK